MKTVIQYFILFTVLLFATVNDLADYTVGNLIIHFGLIGGVIFQIMNKGPSGILIFISGILVPFFILILFFLFHMLGAGDVKLFCVIGGLLGTNFVIKSIIVSLFIGAILSIIHLIHYRNLRYRLQYLANYISTTMKEKKINPYYIKDRDGTSAVIPFTLAIVISTILLVLEGCY